MAGNAAFLRAEPTLAWLSQFEPEDQLAAITLLRSMTLVSRDAFAERLRYLILHRVANGPAPVGLYVERELTQHDGVALPLFKQDLTKAHRALGGGPKPVDPAKFDGADVGSEGIVAHLISEICRSQRKQIFNHPGPEAIRKHRIRRFILVTDFIGSGKRATTYLQAAWQVRSVRSWWSARATKGLQFEVLAYASTPRGRSYVERQPCRPSVHVVVGCQTIETAFSDSKVRKLCEKYTPVSQNEMPPTGYAHGGALIAFAHGVPNNAPAILHKRSSSWTPLFQTRITSTTRRHFAESMDLEDLHARLKSMRQARLAEAGRIQTAKPHAQKTMLVLAALSRPPREVEALSRKTGLTILEVDVGLKLALRHGWVDGQYRLTEAGHAELVQARQQQNVEPAVAKVPAFYYPTTLRAPRRDSS